jgi:pimeloyl-ACP methyl ester carboxylesterase
MTTSRLAADTQGDGAAIVLIHGLTFSRKTWDPITELLARRHQVIAIDLPGHGDSDGSAADPPEVVARLHHTLETFGVERPTVVGHSAGALVATGYAATHPTAAVVNIDQPLLVAGFAAFLQQVGPSLRGSDFTAAFAPFEHSIGVHDLPEPERTRVNQTRRVSQDTVLDHWHLPLTTPPAQLQATVDEMLDAVNVPYLYLSATDVPTDIRDHLQAHLNQVDIESWPGHGHVLHLADPHRFAKRVEDFVATSASTSGGH